MISVPPAPRTGKTCPRHPERSEESHRTTGRRGKAYSRRGGLLIARTSRRWMSIRSDRWLCMLADLPASRSASRVACRRATRSSHAAAAAGRRLLPWRATMPFNRKLRLRGAPVGIAGAPARGGGRGLCRLRTGHARPRPAHAPQARDAARCIDRKPACPGSAAARRDGRGATSSATDNVVMLVSTPSVHRQPPVHPSRSPGLPA